MPIEIQKMETDEEIQGKAYVHWRAWHEAYPGLISQNALDRHTQKRCEQIAFCDRQGSLFVAKDAGRVIGFAGCGTREDPDTGEIFAVYTLSEYYGKGVGQKLMEACLRQLQGSRRICLWVLKENRRAIRFYEKCGFSPDGEEVYHAGLAAAEIRMVLTR